MLGNAPDRVARQSADTDETDLDGYAMFVGIVSGLATGGIMIALIECAMPITQFVTRLFA